MKIKKLDEFKNYNDDVVKNLPKELSDGIDDVDIDKGVYVTPELEDVFHHLVLLTIKREYEQIDEILYDLDEIDRKEMIETIGELFSNLQKKFKYVAKQN